MKTPIGLAAAAVGLTALLAAGAALGAQLSPDQIRSKLEAAGYKDVHDIEFDDGRYEAEATTAAGTRVDLDIDPNTGAVTNEEPD